MANKEECICEPLEVDAPQPLQKDIIMKDIKLCINVLNKAKDCKYRTQYLFIVREERYHLLNIINKIKTQVQENKENLSSSKEDLERNRFLKEMEIELERNKIIHMRKEWARQQNSLAKVQENLFKKCRLLSLHSNFASLQGHSLCSPLALLLEKKEVVEFFLDEQDTYLISFVEIASGCLTSYVRTYAYEAPLEDSPDTGFILALYTCIAHISALPNGRAFLMGHKECQEMVCEFISDLPRLKYCSTKKIKLAIVKILHNLGRSQNGSSYLWNCEELPDTLNQLIEQEFDPNIYKLILEVFSEITRKVPDEECFNRLTNSINRERLSELTLSKYTGVNHIPKVILANVDRADKFFANLREQQKLQEAISKHSMKKFDMADLWSDDSLEPGANCRRRAESYEKCTCHKPRISRQSKSETCIWASKPVSKSASSKSISVKISCRLRGSRTSRSVGTAVSSTREICRESKDGKSVASLKVTVSKNVGKSSSKVNSACTIKKSSTTGCKCVPKKSSTSKRSSQVSKRSKCDIKRKSSTAQRSSQGSKCDIKRKSSTAQRSSKGSICDIKRKSSTAQRSSQGSKSDIKRKSSTAQRSSKGRVTVQVSSNKNLNASAGCQCASNSQSGTSRRSSKVRMSEPVSSIEINDQRGCKCISKSQSGTSRRHSKLKVTTKISSSENSKVSTSCPNVLQARSSQIRKGSKKSISMKSVPSHTDGCPCASKSSKVNEKGSDISRRKSSYKSCNSIVSVYQNSQYNHPNQNTSMVPWTPDNRQLARLSDCKPKDRVKLGPFKINNKIVIHAPSKPHKVVTRIKIKGISLADQPGSSRTP